MDYERLERIAQEAERKLKLKSSSKSFQEKMRKEKAMQDKLMELVGKLQSSNDPKDFIVNPPKSSVGEEDEERAKKRKKVEKDAWRPWALDSKPELIRTRMMKDWLGDSPEHDEASLLFTCGINRAQFRKVVSDIAARNHPFYMDGGVTNTCLEAKIMVPILNLRHGQPPDDVSLEYFGMSRKNANQAFKEFDNIFKAIYGYPPTQMISQLRFDEYLSYARSLQKQK